MSADQAIILDSERAAGILSECVPQVFADMAFMDAVPVAVSWGPAAEAERERPASDGNVHIAIDMLKPLSCRLELEFPRALADRINETLYGGPEESAAGDDSSLELLNVAAGAFLSGYFGAGASFKLELPFYLFGADVASGQAIARIDLNAEGLPVALTLRSMRYRY